MKKLSVFIIFLLMGSLTIAGVFSSKELAFQSRDAYVISEKDRLVAEADFFDIGDKECQISSLDFNSTRIHCYVMYNYSIGGNVTEGKVILQNDTTEGEDWNTIWKKLRLDFNDEDQLGKVEKFTYTERNWAGRYINKGVIV